MERKASDTRDLFTLESLPEKPKTRLRHPPLSL
jgi:hypothetical protein